VSIPANSTGEAVFGHIRQHLGSRQDRRHVVVGFGNGLAERNRTGFKRMPPNSFGQQKG
jgi:hypothetical protein